MEMKKIVCSYCGTEQEKRAAEINRQLRKGRMDFFCNGSCAGKTEENVTRISSHNVLHRFALGNGQGPQKDEFSPFRSHLRRARQRKHVCEITLEDLKDIWTGRCALTGLPIYLTSDKEKKDLTIEASLDRIDSKQGYIQGNIQWVSVIINLAKGSLSQEQILAWIKLLKE